MNWVMLGVGLLVCLAGVLDWDWYMHHPKMQFLIRIFDRDGARKLCIVIGGMMALIGALRIARLISS